MIIRVFDEQKAKICDKLLEKLVLDERKYDSSIDENIKIENHFTNLIKDTNNILLVYEEDNIIKGYIYARATYENNKVYLLDGLYVEEEARGKGIGTKLIKEALRILKENNITNIDINVLKANEGAYNLYKKLGFIETKVTLRKEI